MSASPRWPALSLWVLAAQLAAQQDPAVPDAPRVLWHYPDALPQRDPPVFAKGMLYVAVGASSH